MVNVYKTNDKRQFNNNKQNFSGISNQTSYRISQKIELHTSNRKNSCRQGKKEIFSHGTPTNNGFQLLKNMEKQFEKMNSAPYLQK